jgi:hypothetical protein
MDREQTNKRIVRSKCNQEEPCPSLYLEAVESVCMLSLCYVWSNGSTDISRQETR